MFLTILSPVLLLANEANESSQVKITVALIAACGAVVAALIAAVVSIVNMKRQYQNQSQLQQEQSDLAKKNQSVLFTQTSSILENDAREGRRVPSIADNRCAIAG